MTLVIKSYLEERLVLLLPELLDALLVLPLEAHHHLLPLGLGVPGARLALTLLRAPGSQRSFAHLPGCLPLLAAAIAGGPEILGVILYNNLGFNDRGFYKSV